MAENKKSFVLYADIIHTVKKMPKEKAGELFMTILQYVNDENPIVDDIVIDLVFEPIKQQLKRDLVKYEETIEKRRESGSKGGKARARNAKQNQASAKQMLANASKPKQSQANQAVNDNDNVNDIHREILPVEIIGLYKMRVSSKQQKVKETKVINEIALNKSHDRQKILIGIQNYSEKIKELEEQYITNLLDFIKDNIYLDYQDIKIAKVELDYKGRPIKGNFNG
jgi:hypothetical protein